MSIFVLKSTWAYLYLFAILSLGYARNVPRDDGTRAAVDLFRRIFPSLKFPCFVPPQPTNGGWKLDPLFCDHGPDCGDVAPGSFVNEGTHLIYTCDSGYRVEGEAHIYCTEEGKWTAIPSCIHPVEAGAIASSSMTTTTAASSDSTQEETFELSESGINQSKTNNAEILRRSERDILPVVEKVVQFGCTVVIENVIGDVVGEVIGWLGSIFGVVISPVCQEIKL